jgi:hypothetical protein
MIEGYYFSASCRFTQWFELGSYYSVYYPFGSQSQSEGLNNPTISGNKDYTKDWALSTRFDFNEYWAFKVEGHRMNGTAYPLFRENDDFPDKRWWLLAAKITFSF